MKHIFARKAALAAAWLSIAVTFSHNLHAQDTTRVQQLDLQLPLVDFPQTSKLAHHYPSMQQSLTLSNTMYDLSFRGIDAAANAVFGKPGTENSRGKRILSASVRYGAGLAFARYGSELPIPLGVWAHEEFHRAVLGVNGISSKNGNWIGTRWDGTVFGVSDDQLATMKRENLSGLLYSYVAGVQSEVMSTRTNVVHDTYTKRSFYKNPLYAYNAWYVWNYFRFATSSASDSVKVLAPPHESVNASERDFAGSDLNAWVYDMFSPNAPFSNRDDFPNGEGENRRLGYSDLSHEAQNYLQKQKKLALLNFLNPAIFCINRFSTDGLAFNVFFQYAPTHFGNDISIVVPVWTKKNNLLFAIHNYNNHTDPFFGAEFGIVDKPIGEKFRLSAIAHAWSQPENFYAMNGNAGGAMELDGSFAFTRNLSVTAGITAKSKGWMAGNPYLAQNISCRAGLSWSVWQ